MGTQIPDQPGAPGPDNCRIRRIFVEEMLAGGNGLGNGLVVMLPPNVGGVIGEANVEMRLEDKMNGFLGQEDRQPTVPRTIRRVLRVSSRPGACGLLRRLRIRRTSARTRSSRSNLTVVRL